LCKQRSLCQRKGEQNQKNEKSDSHFFLTTSTWVLTPLRLQLKKLTHKFSLKKNYWAGVNNYREPDFFERLVFADAVRRVSLR
jgi:hypothetical protein